MVYTVVRDPRMRQAHATEPRPTHRAGRRQRAAGDAGDEELRQFIIRSIDALGAAGDAGDEVL
jgi:hypothetical protein